MLRLCLALLVAACASTPPASSVPPAFSAPPQVAIRGVGVRTLGAIDPITRAPLPLAVVYPSSAPTAPTRIGPYELDATRDAPLAAGVYPLVAISHGHAGSLWGHHDLAEALARAGYIVALVEHIGDSWRDPSGFRSDRVLYGRAYQVSATIDAALADPALAAHIDPARIAVAGFSAGGYTALLLVGAQPHWPHVEAYCARHPDDAEICGGPMRRELTEVRPMRDPRVRAAFVMAPLAAPFRRDELRAITAPVFLAWAAADRVLLPDEHAAAIAPLFPPHVVRGTRVIPDAGHFVFLAPCEAELARDAPPLCSDPPGVDRRQVHAALADDAIRFFAASLVR